jgi:TatD DNase family protein
VSTNLESSRRSAELATSYPEVYAALGIHPHDAGSFVGGGTLVRALLQRSKVVAIGEIGLDYVRGGSGRDVQMDAFRRQAEWARELNLPMSVHNRDADDDVLHIVRETGARTILHCFSGTPDMAERALSLGCYLSFAGNVTFPKATQLREVAALVPSDRLLLESDAPVLAPQTHRGRRNEPAYLTSTAKTVAAARGIPVDLLAQTVSANAETVFRWGRA